MIADMESYLRSRRDFAEAPPRLSCRVVLADVCVDAVAVAFTTYILSKGVSTAEMQIVKSAILCDLADLVRLKYGFDLAVTQVRLLPSSQPLVKRGVRRARAVI